MNILGSDPSRTSDETYSICSRYANILSRQGVFFLPSRWRLMSIVFGPPLVILGLVFWSATQSNTPISKVWAATLGALIVGAVLVLYIFLVIFVGRETAQKEKYEAVLHKSLTGRHRTIRQWLLGKQSRQGTGTRYPIEWTPGSPAHVFCATDIVSGQPVYFGIIGCYPPPLDGRKVL